jgi:hypothetical protein
MTTKIFGFHNYNDTTVIKWYQQDITVTKWYNYITKWYHNNLTKKYHNDNGQKERIKGIVQYNIQIVRLCTVSFTDLDQGREILSRFSLPKSMKHSVDDTNEMTVTRLTNPRIIVTGVTVDCHRDDKETERKGEGLHDVAVTRSRRRIKCRCKTSIRRSTTQVSTPATVLLIYLPYVYN